jgi:hypothetical protein
MLLRRKLFLSGLVLSALLCFSLVSSAKASSNWNKTYGGTGNDSARSLVATSDGGYAIAGATDSFGAGNADFWLVKTDANGVMEWNRTYGGDAHMNDCAYSLIATSDGGYAIAGELGDISGASDFWLVKTDAFGNMQWNQTYGELYVFMEAAYSLAATSDGGYVMAGTNGRNKLMMVKTDALGNMEWNKTYGEGPYEAPYSLVATSDGGCAIAGCISSLGAGGTDFWLVKADENGIIPEYSSWLVPALVLTAGAFIIINKKRLLNKHSQRP